MRGDLERFDHGLWLSVALHLGLAALLLFVPGWYPAYGDVSWGSEDAGGGGISVGIVTSMSGIPLPSPAVVTEGAIANDSAGAYEPEPVPEPDVAEPEPAAEPVPETVAPVEDPAPAAPTPPPPPPEPPAPEPPESRPDNAIPFGGGGRPDINYGTATGEGVGLEGGAGAFGQQYGAYVDAITRRISEEWLKSMVDAAVRTAPRVYIRFDILRDGTIDSGSIRVERPSGIASLDNSARRAVFAASPLAPLPDAYRGSRVSVQFWFEYTR